MTFNPLLQFKPDAAFEYEGRLYVQVGTSFLGVRASSAQLFTNLAGTSFSGSIPAVLYRDFWAHVCENDCELAENIRKSKQIKLMGRS